MNTDSLFNKTLKQKQSNLFNLNTKYTFRVVCNHSIKDSKLFFTNYIYSFGNNIQNDMIKNILSIDGVVVESLDENSYNKVFPYRPRHDDKPVLKIDDRLYEIIKKYDKSFDRNQQLLYMHNIEKLDAQIMDPSRKIFRIAVRFDNENNNIIIYIIDPHHLIYSKDQANDYDKVKGYSCDLSVLKKKNI